MKKVYVWGLCLSLVALLSMAAVGEAQQASGQAGQPSGFDAIAPGAQPGQPGQQQSLQQQPGIQTRQNIMTPGNRFGQERGANLQGGIADPAPNAAEFPAPSRQPGAMRDAPMGGGQGMAGRGGGGELGVWLVSSGGPGVEIRRITEGGAAAQAGLQPGDVILQVNDRGATSPRGVAQMIREIPAGEMVVLEIWRDGTTDEMEVMLQPVREQYEVGFGDREESIGRSSGDLASRTMRLEEQLAMVMRELKQLRQEMAQIRTSASSQPAAGEAALSEPAADPGFDAMEEPATGLTPATEPPATELPAQSDPFGASATEPATEPATEEPATEPVAEGEDDLFGGSTTEEATPAEAEPAPEEATPGEAEPAAEEEATETETETESESEDLFQ
jgi:hypothetical protein